MQAGHQRLVIRGDPDQLVELAGQGAVLFAQVIDLPLDQRNRIAGFMGQLQFVEDFRVANQEVRVLAQVFRNDFGHGHIFIGHFKIPSNT